MASTGARRRGQKVRRRARSTLDLWVECFSAHNILTYASAIALRVLVSLIPLTLLGAALLGVFGLEDVWKNSISPAFHAHFTPSVWHAVDTTAQKIFSHDTAPLLVFAAALSIWDIASAVRACMGGIDAIYEQRDARSALHRFGLSLALGLAIGICVIGALLVLSSASKLAANNGFLHALLGLGRWALALALLGVAVGLLVHFAPVKRRAERWVGLGTVLVVVTWAVTALIFRWFVSSIANFRSASGILAAFLVLTTFVYTSSIIFLVGVQLDELLRKDAASRDHGLIDRLRGG
jgi:membrane protein